MERLIFFNSFWLTLFPVDAVKCLWHLIVKGANALPVQFKRTVSFLGQSSNKPVTLEVIFQFIIWSKRTWILENAAESQIFHGYDVFFKFPTAMAALAINAF